MGLLNILSFGLGVAGGTQAGLRVAYYQQPRPHPHLLASILDHPLRRRYRDPVETLGPFGLGPGMTALDLGCGTGTFSVEMARLVGQEGTVHAVDLQAEMIERAQARVEAAGLSNRVRFHQSGAYQIPLADDSVDVAVLIATLTEIPDRLLALNELRRVLKPGGRLAISEEMPHPGYVPAPVVRKWLRVAGFRYGGQRGTPFCYSLLYFND